jgi:hypothetical protein
MTIKKYDLESESKTVASINFPIALLLTKGTWAWSHWEEKTSKTLSGVVHKTVAKYIHRVVNYICTGIVDKP